jgi:sugar phosphate permease
MKKPSFSSHNYLSFQDSYEEINNFKKRKSEKTLSRKFRWLIFIVFLITNTICNLDHGSIPACIKELQYDLNAEKNTIGFFGSLVYFGNFVGSLFSMSVINYINRKLLFVITLVLNAICLYTFTIIKSKWILFINRIACGICQVK